MSATSSHDFTDDVVRICRDLIRIDTSNYGGNDSRGEREAAEYCAVLMRDAGMEPTVYESSPGRASVVGRVAGWDPQAPALILHGHLDVVPADASEWSVDPFSAELRDGMIWGRGAVDMKGMDAMILAVLGHLHRTGQQPRRDLIVAFFADEEAGGVYGARWMVDHHPEVFAGATEAISEVGGFSTDIRGQRAYLLQTAEKGLAWLNLTATGAPGHGSSVHPDNAVTRLSGAIERIGNHAWPLDYTKTTRALLEQVAEICGVEFDETDPTPQLEALGTASRFVGSTLRNSTNPTGLTAGYKHNVIPGKAQATVDVRFLPGQEDEVMTTLRDLAGEGVDFSHEHRDISLEVPFSGALVDLMVESIQAEDPGAPVLPFMMSGGTDNKSLSQLGIAGYGFAPLKLPADLDFTGLFHGIDERVPVEALDFGCRVLHRMLEPR
ncbi:M20/M25/M40 family metallo-hydrolase [Citricoccus nitrophenolicus]|uniref:Acetylornithine deacetylase/succinyl-diaminopimelate desuccinylase-like protein n=1 Tax=Citricoccus muralis TaxID=169134 RepID=A0A3D9LD40_9MICC|nr:M20/M25/M40 family metallo-hydrolase [Citricoccus muralis]REE03093.1 acetylornithine deacetylase/succinyl-diaminopimelate desuccinylase-like protein [Citricoccus muralis]